MVKKSLLIAGLGLGLLNSACHTCTQCDSCHSTKCCGHDYHTPLTEWWMEFRNCQRAKQAWRMVAQANGGIGYSSDYETGFKHGYADYLTRGGTGNVPAVPPRRYWKLKFESPEGRRAIEEWYAGFEHGVAEAQASGFREASLIPTTVLIRKRPYGQGNVQMQETSNVEVVPATPPGVPMPSRPMPLPR